MRDYPELLHALMQEMEHQRGLHRPGPFWQQYAARTAAALERKGLAAFRSDPERGRGFADVPFVDPLHGWDGPTPRWMAAFHRARTGPLGRLAGPLVGARYQAAATKLRAAEMAAAMQETVEWFADRYGIPDTRVGDPARVIDVAGHRIGENYLRAFAWIRDLEDAGVRPHDVLEVGGGFGAFSHVLRHCYDLGVHIYVDIPPILYIGSRFLAAHGPVDDHLATRGATPLRPREGVVTAIPPWRLQDVEAEVDFAWNASSFQEMTAEMVAEYAAQLGRLTRGCIGLYVYSGGHTTTLATPQVVDTVAQGAGRTFEAVEASHAAPAVPGQLFLARAST